MRYDAKAIGSGSEAAQAIIILATFIDVGCVFS